MPVIKIKKEDGTWEEVSGSASGKVKVDASLSTEGAAADAKAVGDALAGKQPVGDYALSSSVEEVKALIGDTPVSTQVSDAVSQKSQVQIIKWEADD